MLVIQHETAVDVLVLHRIVTQEQKILLVQQRVLIHVVMDAALLRQ